MEETLLGKSVGQLQDPSWGQILLETYALKRANSKIPTLMSTLLAITKAQ